MSQRCNASSWWKCAPLLFVFPSSYSSIFTYVCILFFTCFQAFFQLSFSFFRSCSLSLFFFFFRPWKAGGKASDGAAHGEASAMSPISMAACSTPRTVMSPRATLTTPRAVAAAASAVNSVTAASSTANGWGRSMRSFSAGVDCDSTAAASWWSELDLSPPRLDYPDGLQKWRWDGVGLSSVL